MSNFALLNNVEHQDIKIITDRSAKYGDDVMFTMAFTFEFRDLQACYPILLHRDKEGNFFPLALLGFRERENLFLDESGWHAPYVPAMIRRQPFLIGYQRSRDQLEPGEDRIMSLDMDSPRVNTEVGESLFQPLGGRTPFLESATILLENVYQGYEQNKKFVKALEDNDLIESITFEIQLDDGSVNQLFGFSVIDEDKLQQLSGETLESFSLQGFLMPIFMMLASTTNIRTLVDLRNRTLESE